MFVSELALFEHVYSTKDCLDCCRTSALLATKSCVIYLLLSVTHKNQGEFTQEQRHELKH